MKIIFQRLWMWFLYKPRIIGVPASSCLRGATRHYTPTAGSAGNILQGIFEEAVRAAGTCGHSSQERAQHLGFPGTGCPGSKKPSQSGTSMHGRGVGA